MPRAAAPKTSMDSVLAALLDVEAYPAPSHPQSSRQMLAEGLPHALPSSAAQEMHKFQVEFVTMVRGVLTEALQTAEVATKGCVAKAAQFSELIKDHESAHAKLVEAAAKAEEEATAAAAALTDAEVRTSAAKADLAELESEKEQVMESRADIKEQKKAVDRITADLEQYESGGEGAKAPVKQVVAFLDEIGVEKPLLVALPPALELRQPERQAFDTLTVEEARKAIAKQAASVAEQLAAGEPQEAYATSEALGAWAILEVAQEALAEKADEVTRTKRAVKEAQAAVKSSTASEEDLNKSMSAALCEQALAEARTTELGAAIEALEKCRNPPAEAADAEMAPAEVEGAAGAAEAGAPPES